MTRLIYLMGAGRSGTTALATLLNGQSKIKTLGELHQLPEHTKSGKICSCGVPLADCEYWSNYKTEIELFSSVCYQQDSSMLESHKNIWRYYLNSSAVLEHTCYQQANQTLFDTTSEGAHFILVDSSKYIGRALALNVLITSDIKFLYIVRDPRGVVYSFSKKVQTSRGTFSACLYYWFINIAAEFVRFTKLKGKVLKVRYEDILRDPDNTLAAIQDFTNVDLEDVRQKIKNNGLFDIGHIIGGNRLRSSGSIRLKSEDNWKENIGVGKRFFVYLLTLPLNILNGYRP